MTAGRPFAAHEAALRRINAPLFAARHRATLDRDGTFGVWAGGAWFAGTDAHGAPRYTHDAQEAERFASRDEAVVRARAVPGLSRPAYVQGLPARKGAR